MRSFKDRIAQLYYTHGLIIASHPYALITWVLAVVFIACYPLRHLPLPGNTPLQYRTPVNDFNASSAGLKRISSVDDGKKVGDDSGQPLWYSGQPLGFIQQLEFKIAVSPWQPHQMIQTDAFRAPLKKVFKIVDAIDNFRFSESGKTHGLSELCYQVSETLPASGGKGIFPEYNCLIISPANLWMQDRTRFMNDGEILKTISRTIWNSLNTCPLLRDVVFGVPWKNTGIPRYMLHNRQRVINFAVTIALRKYNKEFLDALHVHLLAESAFSDASSAAPPVEHLVHVYYKDVNYLVEYTLLLVTYVVLFLYIYFSVRKIEMVKSKWGLALSAVATVVASLLMSIGLCTFFGLQPTLLGSEIFEIFPYLVVIIGLENILVLTKSVVSTPVHLDVKYRIAQGLSREGWSITKNILIELLILLVGFFTFVPAIQEFCLFACVGLLSDFFLQMVFFATVLSIDIRRMELSDLHKKGVNLPDNEATIHPQPLIQTCPVMNCLDRNHQARIKRASSYSNITRAHPGGSPPTRDGRRDSISQTQPNLPKRLKLIYFLGSNRVGQRMLMICTVAWIGLILYNTGLVDHVIQATFNRSNVFYDETSENFDNKEAYRDNIQIEMSKLVPDNLESWTCLSYAHWPTLFGFYNISMLNRYISILPTMHFSAVIAPEEAIASRHPTEQEVANKVENERKMYASQSDYSRIIPLSNLDPYTQNLIIHAKKLTQYPKTSKEFILTLVLAIISAIFVVYFMMVLYRCMCSRNYARRRTWWTRRQKRRKSSYYVKQIRATVPLVLIGHDQEVECLDSDGPLVISSCLSGQIRVWDSTSGECLTAIHRKSVPAEIPRSPCSGRNIDDSDADLYEEYHGNEDFSVSTPTSVGEHENKARKRKVRHKRFESWPDLTPWIETNFTSLAKHNGSYSDRDKSPNIDNSNTSAEMMKDRFSPPVSESGYDFSQFHKCYVEHRQSLEERLQRWQRQEYLQERAQLMIESQRIASQRSRSHSLCDQASTIHYDATVHEQDFLGDQAPQIWCLTCNDNLIIVGCSSGRIEFWDALTGMLKCIYSGSSNSGVTSVCFVANRVIAARIDGIIDFLELETFCSAPVPGGNSSDKPYRLHNRGHYRANSGHMRSGSGVYNWNDIIHCSLIMSSQAHQQPINILVTESGRVVSASQDHSLKVFRLEDCLSLFTLHGHLGNVTALFLDKVAPLAAASGCENGTVRLWDLLTGVCVHKLDNHKASISTVTCTPTHVISASMDDRMCIWERCRGVLLHSVRLDVGSCSSLGMLTSNILITSGQGCIMLWDVTKGEFLQIVALGNNDQSSFVRQLRIVNNATVFCDYGNELRVVNFPSVLEKVD